MDKSTLLTVTDAILDAVNTHGRIIRNNINK